MANGKTSKSEKVLILGAGLAGLSTSYHLGHQNCVLLEGKHHPFGHVHSYLRDGFTWDEGPHVSFTKHDYVRNLFAKNVKEGFRDFPVRTINYFKGSWIDHPAQSNLFQLDEPLRSQCLVSFLDARKQPMPALFNNYGEWLDYAFGRVFRKTFPELYTMKYWTVGTHELSTEWIGTRVFFPSVEDVVQGSQAALSRPTHYISRVRYPKRGGYQSFCDFLATGARITYGAKVVAVDLKLKMVCYMDAQGKHHHVGYERLINTLPLPDFVNCCCELPEKAREAARRLRCSSLTLVNVTAPHATLHDGNWYYIYDLDKYSTRINQTERLSVHNAPKEHTGVQVEVYHGPWKPLGISRTELEHAVLKELVEMGFLDPALCNNGWEDFHAHSVEVPWANVVFEHDRRDALKIIWEAMEPYGLIREPDDLDAMPDWGAAPKCSKTGNLVFAGRFAQWRYFWSDDCVLRGAQIGDGDG